jgi:type IV pilus assembly protein PilA
MIKTIRSQKGFSLVELMVVVAIIGILAAIAIPNFQRFTAKSKQSEVKSDLAMLYQSSRAFQAEWGTFASHFSVIGYAPSGSMRYEHGFAGDFPAALPNNYSGPPLVAGQFDTAAYCAVAANGCTIVVAPAVAHTVPPTAVAMTVNTFTAAGNADIAGNGVLDNWTMDQLKTLTNTANGLP